MKICVFGAGAIGGYMAGELALAGHEVCAIARGAHLAAIRSHGLKLIVEGQTRTADLPASDDPATFGPQDIVICALKAQQAHASAGAFAPLLCHLLHEQRNAVSALHDLRQHICRQRLIPGQARDDSGRFTLPKPVQS